MLQHLIGLPIVILYALAILGIVVLYQKNKSKK